MKTGIFSILTGIAGLLAISYFTYQANQELQETGRQIDAATPYFVSAWVMMLLFVLEAAGLVAGFMSYKKNFKKLGLFGMGLCTLNIIVLYGQL
jgi:hypothetical protein